MRLRSSARVVGLSLLLSPMLLHVDTAPAKALCGGPPTRPSLPDAYDPDHIGVVVVAQVEDTRAAGYNALLHVEEVWAGGPVDEWVTIRGSRDESDWAWEEDTPTWKAGTRYLLEAKRGDGELNSIPCTDPYPVADRTRLTRSGFQAPIANGRPFLWAWQPFFMSLWPALLLPLAGLISSVAVLVRVRRRRKANPALR